MNKKKILIAILFFISVVSLLLIVFKQSPPVEPALEKPVVVRNDLPNLPITTTSGHRLSTRELKGRTILVFFQPNCDHCQREATQIAANMEKFKNYNIYFISSDKLEAIEKFGKEYKLDSYPNVYFARTEGDQVLKNLGPIDTPSVYIYSNNSHLIKALNGETPIERILEFL